MSEDFGECDNGHVWRLGHNEESCIRKCAYCLRQEIMKGTWEKLEEDSST